MRPGAGEVMSEAASPGVARAGRPVLNQRPTGSDMMPKAAIIGAALAGFAALVTAAGAQPSVEQFYKGKQIRLIVSSEPGGGYTTTRASWRGISATTFPAIRR